MSKKDTLIGIGIGIGIYVIIIVCLLLIPKKPEKIENTETDVDKNVSISEDVLEWFETNFFNIDEDRMPNMFLFTEYDSPKNIDLSHVFYNGADGRGGGEITEKERYLVTGSEEWECDISRTTKKEMDEWKLLLYKK